MLQSAWKPARPQFAAAFSTSNFRREKAGESDDELIAKLESEIQMEEEMKDQELPTSVKDYLENGPFEIVDTPGEEEVVLTRQFGDEKYVNHNVLSLHLLTSMAESRLHSLLRTSTH
jgi:complement component 1 Q subcomponent-binding protein